jgi:hypothetical protein
LIVVMKKLSLYGSIGGGLYEVVDGAFAPQLMLPAKQGDQMFLDMVHGTIDRRILLNYRCDPDALQSILPPQFRPKLYKGYGIGGICMIRFRGLRPRFVPSLFGMNSENAAHRIAVEWEQDGKKEEGVFIPRRDTGSFFNKAFGGRVFPGIFNRSQFISKDTDTSFYLEIIRTDGSPQVEFRGTLTNKLPDSSIFPSLSDAANFFSLGATGYSATEDDHHYHGMELRCLQWTIEPLSIERARSVFYDDKSIFPEGTIQLDSALVLRNIPHEWHSRPDLYVSSEGHGLTNRCTAGPGPVNSIR